MKKLATALILFICVTLFPCLSLYAGDFDPVKSITSAISQMQSGITSRIINTAQAYNSWTQANRQAMPQLAAQWNHYIGRFGAAGAPLFVIGSITNPIITAATSIQPGSYAAQQAGRTIASWTGGIVNVPMKTIWGRDLDNPKKILTGWNRITSITPYEAATYGLFVSAPLMPYAASAITKSLSSASSTLTPFFTESLKLTSDIVKLTIPIIKDPEVIKGILLIQGAGLTWLNADSYFRRGRFLSVGEYPKAILLVGCELAAGEFDLDSSLLDRTASTKRISSGR
jgi:hypothetical protein